MSQLVETARQQLRGAVLSAIEGAIAAGELPEAPIPDFALEVPGDRAHGDWACNAAMAGARAFHAAPRKIAEAITARLDLEGTYFTKCEIAGPGFLNFTYDPGFYGQADNLGFHLHTHSCTCTHTLGKHSHTEHTSTIHTHIHQYVI